MPAIAIFGDSIVHGGGDAGSSWPMRIRLRQAGAGHGDHVFARGYPGDTSFGLLERMADELRHLPVETVVIAIGTNDCQCLRDEAHPRTTDREFAANLHALVDIAKRHARWVLLVDPPEAVDGALAGDRMRFWSRRRLAALRGVLAAVAAERGCWHVDLAGVPEDIAAGDGVHPSAAGHAAIAERVWAVLNASGAVPPAKS